MIDDELVEYCRESVVKVRGWYGWTVPFAIEYVVARVTDGLSHDDALALAMASSRVAQADKPIIA